jgi:hypothetical protein
MSGLRRPHTRIDPDEQHAQATSDSILEAKISPIPIRHSPNPPLNQQSKIINQQCTMHA